MVVKKNHEKMIVWQMADQVDDGVHKLLKTIPKFEYGLRGQLDSASDSIGANFIEGYYSGSIEEYLRFLRYSRRSCAELQERVRRVVRKGYAEERRIIELLDKIIKTGYLFDRLINSLEVKKARDGQGTEEGKMA